MVDDVSENRGRNIDPDTFDSYVEALNDLYIIKDIDAWNPNFRSKTTIVTSPTRHFVDTSLAAYSLSMGPNDLMNDPSTFGLLFEDFAVRDLCIYAGTLGGEVRHYRDGNGLECDAVIHLRNGSYGLIEIKLGGDKLINEGAENLLKMQNKIDTEKMNKPSFLMVLTATGKYAYKREDDVCVVPIGCLKD